MKRSECIEKLKAVYVEAGASPARAEAIAIFFANSYGSSEAITWDPEEEVLWECPASGVFDAARILASGEVQYRDDHGRWQSEPGDFVGAEIARRILAEREGQGAKDVPTAAPDAAGCRRGRGLEGSDGEAVESLRDLADTQHRDRVDRDLRQLGAAIHKLESQLNSRDLAAIESRTFAANARLDRLENRSQGLEEEALKGRRHVEELRSTVTNLLASVELLAGKLARISPVA